MVPELIQDQATPENLAREGLALLADEARCAALERRFTDLHRLLQQNTADKAADALAQIL